MTRVLTSLVFRVCFVTADEDVIWRAAPKQEAAWCVFEVQDCRKADLLVKVAQDGNGTFYVSRSSEACR